MIDVVVILSGGNPDYWPDLSEFNRDGVVFIGVDRGAYHGLQQGLPVSIAVGDFDSLTEPERAYIDEHISEVLATVAEKDDTDTELGVLTAMTRYPESQLVLIGGTGGRMDHFLSNIWLPLQPRFAKILPNIELRDKWNTLRYYLPGDYVIEKNKEMTYLGYMCFVPVTGLFLYDAKYPLTNVSLSYPMSYASNEFVGLTSRFSFETGMMGVIQSKDTT